MRSPFVRLHLTFKLVILKGQCQDNSDLESYISHKGAELGHVLLLNTNRNI